MTSPALFFSPPTYHKGMSSKVTLVADTRVPFPAFFVRAPSKTVKRHYVAEHGISWIQHRRAYSDRGCIMFDIDDTLIDGNEAVKHGFELMAKMYDAVSVLYPVHIVTARPDDDHANVMQLLRKRGFCIPPDRLHMLPAKHYGGSLRHVEEFKWGVFCKIARLHGGVVARFGDKLWDVAHLRALESYQSHVEDRECYIFFDPALYGTLSGKLPGS